MGSKMMSSGTIFTRNLAHRVRRNWKLETSQRPAEEKSNKKFVISKAPILNIFKKKNQ